jgi:hypothetical protein
MTFISKKMKKFFLTITILMFNAVCYSQTFNDEITFIQKAFGKEKKILIANYMNLPQSNSEAFWTEF